MAARPHFSDIPSGTWSNIRKRVFATHSYEPLVIKDSLVILIIRVLAAHALRSRAGLVHGHPEEVLRVGLPLGRRQEVDLVVLAAPSQDLEHLGRVEVGEVRPLESVQQSHFGSRFAFQHFNLQIEMKLGHT